MRCVEPPACSASALMVVLTLFMAVCMLCLFCEAGPSETARALTPNSSAAPEAAAADCVGATVTSIAVFELPVIGLEVGVEVGVGVGIGLGLGIGPGRACERLL